MRVVAKVGTSSLTDHLGVIDRAVIQAVCDQLAELRKTTMTDAIIQALEAELERKARKELIAAGTLKASGTEGDGLTTLAPLDPTKVDPQNPPPKGVYFEIKEKERTCHLTDAGVRKAEELAGVESFYTAGNMEWPHLIDNALKAHHLYQLDRHYMIDRDARENNELSIVIIDEHTGRAGSHQVQSRLVASASTHDDGEFKFPNEFLQVERLDSLRHVFGRDHGALDYQDVKSGFQDGGRHPFGARGRD